ncbi:MAG TPA: phosphoribosylformylglycinamidine synthase subunit PurS [Syntrophomonadaceae bacterium]|nr:phosphoribosylformylglycinamidine synthase subunit PurS [Syntrophomonadaceae bacterium]
MFKANVYVTLKNGVLDPQGDAVKNSLQVLGYNNIDKIRTGKFIEIWLDAKSEKEAMEQVEAISEKLLANLVVEDYRVEVVEVEK